jgi:CheY-like chemotaxis protein
MGEEAAARAVGADGYITKPMEPERFRDAVASYLTG